MIAASISRSFSCPLFILIKQGAVIFWRPILVVMLKPCSQYDATMLLAHTVGEAYVGI